MSNSNITSFQHAQIPTGYIVNGEFLRALIERNHIKFSHVIDDGNSYADINEFLENLDDNDYFINSLDSDGITSGCFLWVYSKKEHQILMPDRVVTAYFSTDT